MTNETNLPAPSLPPKGDLPERAFQTKLPVIVYLYLPEQNPAEWRELDRGPGSYAIPPEFQGAVRLKNCDNDDLRKLAKELAGCEAVTFLHLAENRKITSAGLEYLKPLRQLTGLNLSSCSLTDEGMAHLTALTKLAHLNISYCNRLTDVGLRHLRDLRHMTYLDLQGCVKITNGGIARLGKRNLTVHE
jgi:hypothetical protein